MVLLLGLDYFRYPEVVVLQDVYGWRLLVQYHVKEGLNVGRWVFPLVHCEVKDLVEVVLQEVAFACIDQDIKPQ